MRIFNPVQWKVAVLFKEGPTLYKSFDNDQFSLFYFNPLFLQYVLYISIYNPYISSPGVQVLKLRLGLGRFMKPELSFRHYLQHYSEVQKYSLMSLWIHRQVCCDKMSIAVKSKIVKESQEFSNGKCIWFLIRVMHYKLVAKMLYNYFEYR